MPSSRYALIVAGGSGVRMGAEIPKQFLCVNGLPILMHTLKAFQHLTPCPSIFLVLPEREHSRWDNLCKQHSFTIPHTLVVGGDTRYQSVKNGLNSIKGDGLVAIHDGVRPLVSLALLDKCFNEALRYGNAIPAVRPVETVRMGGESNSKQVSRENCWLVQTPQVFNLSVIKRCYTSPYNPNFTDDASVAEHGGESIRIIEGERENIKITTPADIAIAEAILLSRDV
ncbi:2-C-methyl-D-erythritol 4-phosphate cytidylyltransferase [Perlabentimonas gracilis]|uniref:2-C-methyl-D-erythritol 4-phosphate cytidylyltransferase n=1 Tax=Perlabentimonas gracilis TaxID=2715279 RepID=UPI00140B2950|nr:2-C-methyl-D-erythritol 4-phosphate cytidylyltransferase [Perlabentimonas gracilis]NHB68970.1 2-C-methyl-D-erythritol 4-phosphate cytidylyltransferase [Perlabentimonas gracilis]